jgi:malate synthase
MFSFIKTMRSDPGRVMPDRGFLTMEMPFMRAYTLVGLQGVCCARALESGGCWGVGGVVNLSFWGEATLSLRLASAHAALVAPTAPPPCSWW